MITDVSHNDIHACMGFEEFRRPLPFFAVKQSYLFSPSTAPSIAPPSQIFAYLDISGSEIGLLVVYLPLVATR
jgi:hypothetical protein